MQHCDVLGDATLNVLCPFGVTGMQVLSIYCEEGRSLRCMRQEKDLGRTPECWASAIPTCNKIMLTNLRIPRQRLTVREFTETSGSESCPRVTQSLAVPPSPHLLNGHRLPQCAN